MQAIPARTLPAAPPAPTWNELVAHRGALVRFAQRRLQDPALAEDVVHDVYEAVLCGRAVFGGRSQLRSWLMAVLKHKIVDLIRQRAGLDSLDEVDGEEETGRTLASPAPQPDELAEWRQALSRTLERIESLPAGLRDVMRLRVLNEQSTDAVCRELSITQQNLFVRLHRARRLLVA